jgi:fumarate hydratase subunit beta
MQPADILALRAGDAVLLSGTVFTARDAAHQRLLRAIEAGEAPPIPLQGQVIYYCGPAPAPPGRAMGSAGPTSSYRMDPYTPLLHQLGLRGTIGKGDRGRPVREACRTHLSLYLVAVGGAGALLADRVVSADIVAYPDLGPEAIHRLVVAEFPVIVAYDAHGGSVFPGDESLAPLEGEA